MQENTHLGRLDPERAAQYILSIRIDEQVFTVSVFNPIRDMLVISSCRPVNAVRSFTANFKEMMKEAEFLSYTYKQVNVILTTKRFTLVPDSLFNAAEAETLFYYNFSGKENETVLHNLLPKNDAVLLFGISKTLHNLLSEQYEHVAFQSSVSLLAEAFAARSRFGCERKMYACINSKTMELYAFEHGRLTLLNIYDCEADADRMYYLLYAWKQLGMDQMEDELYIVSQGEYESFMRELSGFIRYITPFDQSLTH